jgi:hypothetical protein
LIYLLLLEKQRSSYLIIKLDQHRGLGDLEGREARDGVGWVIVLGNIPLQNVIRSSEFVDGWIAAAVTHASEEVVNRSI